MDAADMTDRSGGPADRPAPDLRPRASAITDRVVAEMTRGVPAFSNAPGPFLDVVAIVVARIVDVALDLFLHLRRPTRAEVRDLVEVCVPPTDQGVTLEDMLRVFQIAQSVLWEELDLVAEGGGLAGPRHALELGRVGVELLTELSRGVTAEYLRGDRVWLQRRDAERALVRGVLDAPPRTEEATRAAHALGLRLFGTWQCALYEWVDPLLDPADLLDQLEAARATWGIEGALAVTGRTVLLAAQERAALPPPSGARVATGGQHAGAQGLRTSHAEATDTLTVARRSGVLRLDVAQARTGRVLLGSLTATAMAEQVLAPLDAEPDGRREMLLETLEAWLDEQGSPTAVGRRLRLHTQSARYRIDQLRAVFGDALDDPDRRLELQLAVRARRLAQTPDGRPEAAV